MSATTSRASSIAAVATLGWDPVTQTYMWTSGASTLGLIALMALTSLAVIVFFRPRGHGPGPWRTLIAPGLSFLALAAILLLVIDNFSILVGSSATAVVLGVLMAAVFLAGVLAAERLRRSRPDRYRSLSQED